MTEKRKKGNGREEVKEYVLGRLHERPHKNDPFVKIAGKEIAEALGIAPQSVNEHVRTLVRHGVFHRERRCYFSESPPGVPASWNAPARDCPDPASTVDVPPSTTQPAPAAADEGCWTFPVGNLLKVFSDASGNVHLVFSGVREPSQNGSMNLPTPLSEPDNGFSEGSQPLSEGSPDSKKEYQEKTNQIKKEKCVNFLGEWVDSTTEEYRKAFEYATKLFNKHGAGVRKGTNPKLINRFVAGFMLKIPLINFQELEEQLKEAEQETAQYESYKGFGKRSGIRRPYIRIANYLKKCFEAAGWIWTKLDTPFETRLKRAHQQPPAAPVFQQIQTEQEAAKPVPASQSVMSIPTDTQILEAEPMPLGSSERKPPPVNIDKIIEQLCFKLPPDVRSPPGTRPVKPPS